MHSRIGWSQPPPGWDAPGWAPLVDPGPRPLHAARSIRRWSWPILAVGGHRRYDPHLIDALVQALTYSP